MTLVCDASAVVAALVDTGGAGPWAVSTLMTDDLIAPAIIEVEVLNVLRRNELAGRITADVAALSISDLFDLSMSVVPFEPFVDRVWELSAKLTSCDAWYVAVAEALGLPLVTLDRRARSSTGPAV